MKDVVKNITYGDLWGNSKKDAYKSSGKLSLVYSKKNGEFVYDASLQLVEDDQDFEFLRAKHSNTSKHAKFKAIANKDVKNLTTE